VLEQQTILTIKDAPVPVDTDAPMPQEHRDRAVLRQRHPTKTQAKMACCITPIETRKAQEHGPTFPDDRIVGQLGLKMVNARLTASRPRFADIGKSHWGKRCLAIKD
jgi:hypothetical protein